MMADGDGVCAAFGGAGARTIHFFEHEDMIARADANSLLVEATFY